MPNPSLVFRSRLRFPHPGRGAFGPGKAELLEYIAATGSLRTAATEMAMSYQRAWTLVREMNGIFHGPLVVLSRGGGTGGGAALTPLGDEVLLRYQRMEAACLAAIQPDWQALQGLLPK